MTTRTYEITFLGTGTRTPRAELADQAALRGTLDRVRALGLELLEVRSVD